MSRLTGGINLKNNINFKIETIIDEYSNYAFKIVDNIVGTSLPYQDKEEIVSDVFYLLWKNQNNINVNLKSYIASITRNCTYTKLKNNKTTFELKEEIIDKDLNLCNDEVIDKMFIVRQKLQELNELERNIFTLYYVDGYKIKEISKNLRLTSSLIKIKLYRIRKKLKEEIL